MRDRYNPQQHNNSLGCEVWWFRWRAGRWRQPRLSGVPGHLCNHYWRLGVGRSFDDHSRASRARDGVCSFFDDHDGELSTRRGVKARSTTTTGRADTRR
eukprot:scaffold57926_cov43-Cyclotella_meneghiniana.AAC.1